MKKLWLLSLLLFPTAIKAELITPQFTQGSMQSTTTTTQEITETIETNVYGSKYEKWSGENIEATSATSAGISGGEAIFSIIEEDDPWTLEITTRAANQVMETIEIDRTIETTATTTSLSVFSQ